MKRNKKVLISGISGFLGSYTKELLIKKGYEVYGLSRREEKENIFKTDYSVEDLVSKFENIDGIIHLAGTRSMSEEISYYHQNEIISQNIYEAAKIVGIKYIVYASSISVYSNQENLPWSENVETDPLNMYGVSKLSIESIGKIYSKKYSMYIKSLRFAHLFGYGEDNKYMINVFMDKAFNKEVLNVNDVKGKREFLYVKDAAKAIELALFKEISGIFNIGSNDILTNLEVAKNINKAFNNEDNINIFSNGENMDSSYMNLNKAKTNLAYENEYNFYEALLDIYRYKKK